MKARIFTLILAMVWSTMAVCQTYNMIPAKEIQEIAIRNAQALWGDVYPADPIPYYGQDDEIVAWRFNFSIGEPFPDRSDVVAECDLFKVAGDEYEQWGGDRYGRILIGARDNLPVLLEYSQCLSAEYTLDYKLQKMIHTVFQESEVQAGKIYYLNHFNTWHEYKSNGTTKYLCTSPTGGVIGSNEFQEKKGITKPFCETGNFKDQWNLYRNGNVPVTDADKYIDYHGCMPFLDWSYGCSPTAAAMLFAWYDYRSLFVTSKYPYFVTSYYERWDNVEGETDYNVANLQLDLALGMSTDTMTGSTQSYNLDNGMRHVANSVRGYDFDIVNRYTLLWTRTKDDINAGKPLIVSIPGHSTTGVGYNDGSDVAITHYTHDPPMHLAYVSRWSIDMITRVSSGGQKGSAIQIRKPFGDPRYNSNGQGELYHAGNYAEITWFADTVPGSWVDISYSTDGGYSYDIAVLGTENDGLYDWLIPTGVSSTKCRVLVNLHDPAMEPYIAGADGSRGNFIIDNGGAIPTMVDGTIYQDEKVTGYYLYEHSDPSWAVIGNTTDTWESKWGIQLFPDDEFNQDYQLITATNDLTNLIVMD
nr:hypothetical protein [Bacteroidota bacterium]